MEELKLQLIDVGDKEFFKSLYCDDDVMHFLSDGMSAAAASDYFHYIIDQQRCTPPECLIYKIIDGAVTVGLVGGFFVPSEIKTVFLGAMILKAYQQQGYSTRAIESFCNQVRREHDVARITTKSMVVNKGATKLMQRLDFELVNVTVAESGDQYNNWQFCLS